MHQSPFELMLASQEIAPQSMAASTTFNGAGVDMQGWDGVAFILNLGATDGTVDMDAESDDNSGFSSPTAITGAAITQLSATDDNNIAILDVYRPTERYVRASVDTGAGAAADFASVLAVRYRGSGVFPVTQAALELVKVAQN
jgi:hypothetical protein